ncbi:MAG: DUF5688 family protein [Catonella sp.]|uniref:DUF5688 family protein n=1 Tax=Catonella sp. TaxID=2382125 RepID=UPI003F9F9D1A
MKYNEFIEAVRMGLSAKLEPYYEVVLKKVAKNNGVYRYGLSVFSKEKAKKVSRIVYLEDFYEEYEENAEYTLENIVDELRCILKDLDYPKIYQTDYTDINLIQDRIIFELVNYEMNKLRLSDRPFIKIMDLAVIFAYVATDIGRDFGVVHITNEVAEQLGIAGDELWNIAKKNTPKLLKAEIIPMSNFIPYNDRYDEEEEMYIICNNKKIGGAGVILYDKILEELSSKLQSDLYILPSSIHETIIISDEGDKDISALQDMVRSINNTVVSTEDILSDNIYHYSMRNKKLEIA